MGYVACTVCGEDNFNELVKDITKKYGVRHLCKTCKRKNNKTIYNKSDDVKNYIRQWRSDNKDKVKLYNKNYYKKDV